MIRTGITVFFVGLGCGALGLVPFGIFLASFSVESLAAMGPASFVLSNTMEVAAFAVVLLGVALWSAGLRRSAEPPRR